MHQIFSDKATRLLVILTSFFVANALIAECIGTKLFSLEALLGQTPKPFSLFGESGLTITLTCGVLLWPLEFIMTDIVNEYYGAKVVRRISYIAVMLIAYAFIMFVVAIAVPADEGFWRGSGKHNAIPDMQAAFSGIFGQGQRIIIGSIAAFLFSQLIDAWVFRKIKQRTGEGKVWLRATGSTIVSQLVDSFIVLGIAFGHQWSWQRILAVGTVNYSYKFTVALLLTPVLYLAERGIEHWLGREKTILMKQEALLK